MTMNLMFAASGLAPEVHDRVLSAVRRVGSRYPQMDAAGPRSWVIGDAFLVSFASDQAIRDGRRPAHEAPDAITVMDGVLLDPSGAMHPYDAREGAADWDTLASTAEGRFAFFRVNRPSGQLEVLVDPLGIRHVFEASSNGAWMVSTSAGVIELVLGSREPDPTGVSMLLATDWVWGTRTIRRGISVVPGGTRTSATAGTIRRTQHFSPRTVALLDQDAFDAERAAALASDMTTMLRTLANAEKHPINCPISGGKDTRVLAALCLHGEVPTRFWTQGDARTRDVTVAQAFVARYRVTHRFANRPNSSVESSTTTTDVLDDWEANIRRLVLRTDGMASMSLIGNVAGIPPVISYLETTLSGLGGEIARHSPSDPIIFHAGSSVARVRAALVRHYL